MAEFDIAAAAFSGPRMLFAKPRVLFTWMAFSLIVVGLYLALMFLLFGDLFSKIFDALLASREPPTELFLQLLPRFGLMILIFLPLGLIYTGMQRAAATRAILTPEDDRTAYLRLSADEMRTIVVVFVVGVLRACAQIAASIVFAIVLGILFAVGGGFRDGNGASVLQPLVNVLVYPVTIFFFLKFALALPQTIDTRQISIFDTWSLTRGHTWRMFASYVIVFLVTMGVSIVLGAVVIGLIVAIGGAGVLSVLPLLDSNPQEALRRLIPLLVPLSVTIAVISALFTPLITALWHCPAAYIYAALAGRREDVF